MRLPDFGLDQWEWFLVAIIFAGLLALAVAWWPSDCPETGKAHHWHHTDEKLPVEGCAGGQTWMRYYRYCCQCGRQEDEDQPGI